jgi:hypothetical protein
MQWWWLGLRRRLGQHHGRGDGFGGYDGSGGSNRNVVN